MKFYWKLFSKLAYCIGDLKPPETMCVEITFANIYYKLIPCSKNIRMAVYKRIIRTILLSWGWFEAQENTPKHSFSPHIVALHLSTTQSCIAIFTLDCCWMCALLLMHLINLPRLSISRYVFSWWVNIASQCLENSELIRFQLFHLIIFQIFDLQAIEIQLLSANNRASEWLLLCSSFIRLQ